MSLKENLIQQAINKVKSVAAYFNPTSNNGNNFWSSNTANTLANVQKKVVTQPANFISNRIDYAKQVGIPQLKSTPITTTLKESFLPTSSGQIGQGFRNYIAEIPKDILNAGKGIYKGTPIYQTQRMLQGLPPTTPKENFDNSVDTLFSIIRPAIKITTPIISPLLSAGTGMIKNTRQAIQGKTKLDPFNAGIDSLNNPVSVGQAVTDNPTAATIIDVATLVPLAIYGIKKLVSPRVSTTSTNVGTPEQLKNYVNSKNISNTQEGKYLLEVANEAEQKGMNIQFDLTKIKQSFLDEFLGKNKPQLNKAQAVLSGEVNPNVNLPAVSSMVKQPIEVRSAISESVNGLPSMMAPSVPSNVTQDLPSQTTGYLPSAAGRESAIRPSSSRNILPLPLIQDMYTPKGIKVAGSTNVSSKTEGLRIKPKTLQTSQSTSTKSPTDSLIDAITSPKTKTRKFVETVRESPNTKPEVKQMVQGQYIPRSNDALSRKARQLIKQDINVARDKALQGLDDESVAIANELIQHYSNLKDFDTAAYVANTTAENLTAHGRAIQAASLYDKLTPEGIQRYAASVLNKVKMDLKPEDAKRLYDQAAKVQSMPPGVEKAMAQQELMNEVAGLIPTPVAQKLITIWKAGLLTGLKTTGRNVLSNTLNQVAEVVKDAPATLTDALASMFTGQRTKTFTMRGMGKGFMEGKDKGLRLLKTGFDERRQMGKLDIHYVNWGTSKVGKAAKVYTETVFRFLGAQDQPFYYSALRRSLYDQAGALAKNAGRGGDKKYIEKLVKNPTEQMIKTAVHDAEVAVFQNNTALSGMINSAKRYLKSKTVIGGAMADFVAPFTGVPSSIIGQVVNYTPVGLAKTIIESIGKGKFDQRQFSEGVGRGLTGMGILAIGSALMAAGMMTLDYPKDKKEQAQWDLEGKNAFNVQFTKGGDWHSIGSLGPEASVLLIGGYLQSGGPGRAFLGGLKQQKEQTFLQGINNLSTAIDDPDGKAKAYFKSTTGSMVPTLIGDLAKGIDPFQRESNNPLESMEEKVPGVRQSLLPQRNVFGEMKPNEQGFFGSLLDVTTSTSAKSDPVIDELRRLSDLGFSATPPKLDAKQTIQKMKVELTPVQLDAFEERAGKLIKQRLDILVQSPNYQGLTDEKKQKAIQDVTSKTVLEVKNSLDLSTLTANTFVSSADAPKNTYETVKVYGEGLIKDPGGVISAISSGQPIRKITGDTVVVERAQGLNNIDKGDVATQIDHKIALELGGDNSPENRVVLSVTDHAAKTQVDNYLGKLLKAGKITKQEAQNRSLNWKSELTTLPAAEKKVIATAVTSAAPSISKTYQVVDKKTGAVNQIDLTLPTPPKLTGLTEVDKSLKSSYSSELTKYKKDVMSLLEDGQLTDKEANDLLSNVSKLKGSGKKKVKKITVKKTTVKKMGKIKFKTVKIKKIKTKPFKLIKFKVPKKIKVKPLAIKKLK